MRAKTKRDLLFVIFAVVLFAALTNFEMVLSISRKLLTLLLPVLVGLALAFALNAPMRGFEKLLGKISQKTKIKIPTKSKNLIALLLSILSIFIVLVFTFTMAIPRITESVTSIVLMLEKRIPALLIWLEEREIDTTFITKWLAEFDFQDIFKRLTQGALTIVTTAFDATMVVFRVFSNAIFSFIIAIYLLLDKNNLSRQFKKLIYTIMPETKAEYLYRVCYLIRDTFSRFLSGQCLEALILAVIIVILFSIFGIPNAVFVALLAAVLAFIPYIGSFIACIIAFLLTVIVNPEKAIVCVVVYLVAQFVEQHFVYPHVVGNSVGLSPFYTIVAVLIGGNLFGVVGMIFFIPLFSVFYTLVRDFVLERTQKKKAAEEPATADTTDNITE